VTQSFRIILLASVLSNLADAADKDSNVWWPQFRGPLSSGLGRGKPPVEFGADKKLVWKVPVGAGLSSPSVWEGRVFLTEFDRTTKQFTTVCIDRGSGKVLWRRTVTAGEIEKVHELSSPAGPTPVTDEERVYVYFGSYGLVSYDMNGNPKWERTSFTGKSIWRGCLSHPRRRFAGA
jgi:outer membrane protein assembly factor BamB